MNHKPIVISQFLMACCLGCNPPPAAPPPPKPVGSLTRAEVESKIKASLNLEELNLAEEAKGIYAGTGTAKDGTKVKVTATRGENAVTWTNEDEKGNKGTGGFGWGVK